MKRLGLYLCSLLSFAPFTLRSEITVGTLRENAIKKEPYDVSHVESVLDKYRDFLDRGVYEVHNFAHSPRVPKARYHTFHRALTLFAQNRGKVVVETGTSRSFVSGGHEGCLSDDPVYWQPSNPRVWDWGAGIFTRVAAECLAPFKPTIHTIDIVDAHIQRCKIITADFSSLMRYHVCSSLEFFKTYRSKRKIDLLYLDSGDICEDSAKLQLEEVKAVVRRNLIAPGGLILIDDVKVPVDGIAQASEYGKARYSIAYLLDHGFDIIEDEYQVLLQKRR
jgi:hypothetical protein